MIDQAVPSPKAPKTPSSRRTVLAQSVLIPLVLLVLYLCLPFNGPIWVPSAALGIFASVAAVPITVRRIRRIRTSDHPMAEALSAISLLASMVILGFATGYYALATHSTQLPGINTRIDSLYFTVTTTGTVGFGDITPTGQGARALVTAHILVNLSLLAGSFRILSGVAGERHRATQG